MTLNIADPRERALIREAEELVSQVNDSWTDADREASRRDLDEMYDEDGLPA